MGGVSIVVIRYAGEKIINSKPCIHCISYMKKLGIKKIYYSNDGNIIYDKINKISTTHISLYHRTIFSF
jgi:hypothetical protein